MASPQRDAIAVDRSGLKSARQHIVVVRNAASSGDSLADRHYSLGGFSRWVRTWVRNPNRDYGARWGSRRSRAG